MKCIIVLAKLNDGELNDLIKNLNENFINYNKNVDLIIFYEPTEKHLIKNIIQYNGGKTIYHELTTFLNSDVHLKFKNEIPDFVYGFDIGYRSMCKFFAGDLFKILKNYNYKYYLRLDTDSRFTNTTRDIFDEFIISNSKYGYVSILNEPEELCYSLNKAIINYIITKNIKTKLPIIDFINQNYNFAYLNNFEMFEINAFTDILYFDLFDYLDKNINEFLKYRWGDHVLRFKYVNLFFDRKDIYYFANLDYFHGGKVWKNTPFEIFDWQTNVRRMQKYELFS